MSDNLPRMDYRQHRRAQLLADKEKAQKKPAKQKSQDLERS